MTITHAQGSLGLKLSDFESVPELEWERKSEILRGPRGILLDAPAEIRIDELETIPFLGARITSAEVARRFGFEGKAILMTTRLDDGSAFAGWAVQGPKSAAAAPLASAADDPFAGASMELFRLELNGAVSVDWKPGTFRTWVFTFDVRSNPVTTRVIKQEITDPAVRDFLEGLRTPTYAPRVSPAPAIPYPSYVRDERSPAIPEADGVSLSIDRVTVGEPRGTLVLRGSFRLPVQARQLVRPMLEVPEQIVETPPTAVLPIHLLVLGNVESDPRHLRLQVPTWDEVNRDDMANARVTGYFNLDLRRLTDLPFQTYAIWCLASGEVGDPVYAALVDPDMVPKPGE